MALAPASVEVRVLASGELEIDPLGTVLQPTAFPPPGARGGPSLAVTVRNITGVPFKLSVRLASLSPSLDDAVMVRGSVAGAVVLDEPLKDAGEWSEPAGLLPSGATSTLRIRFKLKSGLPADAWRGHLDVRELSVKGVRADGAAPPETTPFSSTPDTPAATTPAATTPAAITPGTSS